LFSTPLRLKSGRNNSGQITTRHKGGSLNKKRIISSLIFFKNQNGVVINITQSSSKNKFFALMKYVTGSYNYILLPYGT
jgi:large subunit ribosomal protein L2